MAERVQLQRTKGWRIPENTVIVDRRSKWGNPFVVDSEFALIPAGGQDLQMGESMMMIRPNRALSVILHRAWLRAKVSAEPDYIEPLRKAAALACWCALDERCHADNLIEAIHPVLGPRLLREG